MSAVALGFAGAGCCKPSYTSAVTELHSSAQAAHILSL